MVIKAFINEKISKNVTNLYTLIFNDDNFKHLKYVLTFWLGGLKKTYNHQLMH